MRLILALVASFIFALSGYAVSADHYASSSVMAEGRWARIKVSTSGMHTISDVELRKLGFTDPSKVHVYGLGGRQLDFSLDASTPDDLPLLPSVRTSKGLVFFAVDQFSWFPSSRTNIPYYHTINVYSEDNYYFLSDRAVENDSMPAAVVGQADPSQCVSTFPERIVYEKDLEYAGASGSQIYGEDFRTKRSQTFNFQLPDAADDKAKIYVRFAAKTTNGTSQLTFKANGKALSTSAADRIGSSKASYYCAVTETSKEIDGLNGSLALTIDYSQTGVLFLARLDYIEAFYQRRMALNKGELYFYGSFSSGEGLSVSGCSASTRIWDVTTPWAPAEVKFTLSGDKACFSLPEGGYREFVAFDADAISRTAVGAGTVANQDIHSLPVPDMVIFTYPEYRTGAERIAALHEELDGFRVHILDADQTYNEFSGGKPDVIAFRKALKMWYDRGEENGHKLGYALIMGKALYDNKCVSVGKKAGYRPMPIYESYSGLDEHNSYCNDDLIGMLDDTSNSAFQLDQALLTIPVGRLPVTDATESLQMAQKIEKYVKKPTYGAWRNKVMIIADDDDNANHFKQAQDVYNGMRSSGNGRSFVYDRVYLDSYKRVMTGVGPTYPQATERMLNNYNDGVIYTNYIGHGSPIGWGHEHLWEWEDIISMTNKNLTFMFTATCGFATWDATTRSGAEEIMINPESGVIGMMAATRTVFVDANGRLNSATHKRMFEREENGLPRRFGDVYIEGRNNMPEKTSNSLRYAFIGDPAIRIPGGKYNVEVRKIDGKDALADDPAQFPVLPACYSTEVEGVIAAHDGSVAEDFNGTVILQLYDSERVVTTFGQGDRGVVCTYNDRSSRLAMTKATVTGGRWKATLRVPPEIQGNYSTALISCYAWSDLGQEGNGYNENFYVYGFNPEENTDTEGPEITSFYVNSPNFTNGGLVNANPVIFAGLRDESGINISDSGIGHSMTLTVDGREVYSGLNSYFELDADDPDAGRLAYPLSDLTPGRHTLMLTVWDNANNCSKATLDVNVGAAIDPVIYDIAASVRDTYVDFSISVDRPNTRMVCTLGIFDLNGRRIWEDEQTVGSDMESNISSRWNLCDKSGSRVPRGIYVVRANVETTEGTYSSKSKKIAISAQ